MTTMSVDETYLALDSEFLSSRSSADNSLVHLNLEQMFMLCSLYLGAQKCSLKLVKDLV